MTVDACMMIFWGVALTGGEGWLAGWGYISHGLGGRFIYPFDLEQKLRSVEIWKGVSLIFSIIIRDIRG